MSFSTGIPQKPYMKRLVIISVALLIMPLAFSQTIKVIKKENRIKGSTASGYSLQLDGKQDEVETALNKFLKDYGKTRSTSDYVSVSGPSLGGIIYEGNVLYATTEGSATQYRVWIGLDTTEWRGRDTRKILNQIENMVYQFGVKFYRDRVQKEIDESQRAFDATEKQKTRLVNQNKDLNIRLGNNDQERIHLEKALEANKQEHTALLQKIENNKKAQDSVATAGVQIKKVMDSQKEKQRKIN